MRFQFPASRFSKLSDVLFTNLQNNDVPGWDSATQRWTNRAYAGGVSDGSKVDITVSGTGTTWTIASAAVSNSKMANMAQSTVKGRARGAGTGAPTDLSASQVWDLLWGDLPGTGSDKVGRLLVNDGTTISELSVSPADSILGTNSSSEMTWLSTIPSAMLGNVNHRLMLTGRDLVLHTSASVGWNLVEVDNATRSFSVECAKSAAASLQSFYWRSAPVRVPFGFAAFKTTAALRLHYFADTTNTSHAKLTAITVYGYSSDLTGSKTTIYSDSTSRTPGSASVPTLVEIDRSAFSSTTVPDYLVVEVDGQVMNSNNIGVVGFEVVAE